MDSLEFVILKGWLVDGMSVEKISKYMKSNYPAAKVQGICPKTILFEKHGLSEEYAHMFEEVIQYEYFDYGDLETAYALVEGELASGIPDKTKLILSEFWEEFLCSDHTRRRSLAA